MSESEAFTIVMSSSHQKVYDDYESIHSGRAYDLNTSILAALRRQYPELNLTVAPAKNVPLLQFAAAGEATAELDITTDSIERIRLFSNGNARSGTVDELAETRTFAKYNFKWGFENFILYTVLMGPYIGIYNYILKKPGKGETTISHCAVTDALIYAVGSFFAVHDENFIYVYDGFWTANRALWAEVQKASWKDVILNEEMKKTVTELMQKFFESKDIYQDLGVPWKETEKQFPSKVFHPNLALMFAESTVSLSLERLILGLALMHSLSEIKGSTIPALYVKSAPQTYDIRNVFAQARNLAPCMLILEDIDTIVTHNSRSYFFNEVDGLENNDGIFMVATTNHLDRLDPGLSSRPSRFDRKYLFPLPSEEERIMYCDYWREKLKNKPSIKFPQKLSPAVAAITHGFSFAYLKEAFVSALIVIAGNRSEDRFGGGDDENDDKDPLDGCELWLELKIQIELLRNDMDNTSVTPSGSESSFFPRPLPNPFAPLRLRPSHGCHPWGDRTEPQSVRHSVAAPSSNDVPLAPFSLPRRVGKSSESRVLDGMPLMFDSGKVTEEPESGVDHTSKSGPLILDSGKVIKELGTGKAPLVNL
ncbi:hypothetical protein MMC07_000031 [Pseudocyphellaria aurata]|nr:hypothetical protein [Pseudocyphellaria aurata]